jgi:ketosteroid isomerase-like protein
VGTGKDTDANRRVFGGAICLLVSLGGVVGAGGAADQDPVHPTVQLPPELERVLTDYEAAWRAKDEAALAALFAEDGFVLSGNHPPVRGRAQIEERYRDSGGPLSLRALAYAIQGDIGYIIGAYGRSDDGPDIGKFTLTLTKGEDGRWLIMSDMDNRNQRD